MNHKWQDKPQLLRTSSRPGMTKNAGHRRCTTCGLSQNRDTSKPGFPWSPESPQCQPIKWKRKTPGNYLSEDGRFKLWQEPHDVLHWYIEDTANPGEAVFTSGHQTMREAVEALVSRLAFASVV